jgi:hypothetical protein
MNISVLVITELTARLVTVLQMLVYSPFNHLLRLLAREYFLRLCEFYMLEVLSRGIVLMVLSALHFGMSNRENNAVLILFCRYVNMLLHQRVKYNLLNLHQYVLMVSNARI